MKNKKKNYSHLNYEKKNVLYILFIIVMIISLIILIFLIYKNQQENVQSEYYIPKVYIDGYIDEMNTKEDTRTVKIKYDSSNVKFESYAKMKIQGNTSLYWEKKSYNISLYEDDLYSEKKNIDIGKKWGKQSQYCLKANYTDKTQSRNIVSASIVADVQKKYKILDNAPNNGLIDGFPVEVYSNNEFLGIYTWNIPKTGWLWGISNNDKTGLVVSANTYNDCIFFNQEIEGFSSEEWNCEAGIANDESVEAFNRLIKFIKESSDEEFINNIDEYLNVDATINYIVMMYFFQATDNAGKNLVMVTNDKKIWYPTMYDLDVTFGTEYNGELQASYSITWEDTDSPLWQKMIKLYSVDIANRYFELRKDILTKENVLDKFYNFMNLIPEETWEKEKARWGDEIPGYGIDQIEEYLDYRIPFLDELMNNKLDS
jgi:hypothetical protein